MPGVCDLKEFISTNKISYLVFLNFSKIPDKKRFQQINNLSPFALYNNFTLFVEEGSKKTKKPFQEKNFDKSEEKIPNKKLIQHEKTINLCEKSIEDIKEGLKRNTPLNANDFFHCNCKGDCAKHKNHFLYFHRRGKRLCFLKNCEDPIIVVCKMECEKRKIDPTESTFFYDKHVEYYKKRFSVDVE